MGQFLSALPPLLRANRADQKYEEAVEVAVKKCAKDTKGQTCFICMEAIHSETGEGLVRMCACRGGNGFVHVSCLARQAQVSVAEAEKNNLDDDACEARWMRWGKCRLCEQHYHGVVRCALGWACWKTYLGRPETDMARKLAISLLGSGLYNAKHYEDALSVKEAELAMERRLGAPAEHILITQGNLAVTYDNLGRYHESLSLKRDVYSGLLKLYGEEHEHTLRAAVNYASNLVQLQRFEEAKSLLRRTLPVARRVTRDSSDLSIRMRTLYAQSLYEDDAATLDGVREAVTTLEDAVQIARRVLGGEHPLTTGIESDLRKARAALAARETPSTSNNA